MPLDALPQTWKGVYNHGGQLLNKVPSQGGFDTPKVHVQNWTRLGFIQESAGSSGGASSSRWSNFEIRECSHDKGKYE